MQQHPLIPARMLNEHVYCPRLAWLEWVQGEWASSADTVQGSHIHRRVDRAGGALPANDETLEKAVTIHARSVELSSEKLGVTAKLDLVEGDGTFVQPIDYKRGKRPNVEHGAYDPERVQLCVQGLLLREHGFQCNSGVLYFAASKERVEIPFDEQLCKLTQDSITSLRHAASTQQSPPPLEHSPKCPRCSLVGICLPDEINLLANEHDGEKNMRKLSVQLDRQLPLVVQANQAKIAKKGEELQVFVKDDLQQSVRIREVSQVVVMGNVYITTPCLRALMEKQIPVSWHSYGGWFSGHTIGTGHKNVQLRTEQFRHSFNADQCLTIAKALVRDKILNCRTLLRRNWRDGRAPVGLLSSMKRDARLAEKATSIETLLGVEGAAAARYFKQFRAMLKSEAVGFDFDFNTRNRRPPLDPVNALLSLTYSVLTRHLTTTLSAVGLDAYRGFYHQPRYGRPALALDVMEPFRPLLADSTVITVLNNGEIVAADFIHRAGAVALTAKGRKALFSAFERRMSQEISHPIFGYKASYRRTLELQARLLGRYLLGEIDQPPRFTTR
ncbi:CRISPR-associated endonuclease Cas4/Cas1 [Chromatiales bacterium (ex Bugula neritina AB1)]|nr:CRISPR-associated endonuclease Cas4/Cas1 [Chromatiales bacterium (ex Bugula neritina AB1)]